MTLHATRRVSSGIRPLGTQMSVWLALAVATLVVLATTPPGHAHDYWLQPQRFFLSDGEMTAVQLLVGDHFISESERPLQVKKTVAFQVVSKQQVVDLLSLGKDGETPVCSIAPRGAGNHLIVMERDWSHIELDAAKFNKYLEHEGLTAILKMRRDAAEDGAVGRERYRRYLKSLVQVEGEFDATYSRKIGHRLEILPRVNPCAANIGDRMTVSILFEGKPLRGVQVAAYSRNGGDTKTQQQRTDDKGQVEFMLDRSGLWLIRLVHMRRCENVRGFDWESFWAAYSFQLK